MKIVIADDHSVFREGLKPLVKELDPAAEVIEAGSFSAALEQISKHEKIDLILLDLLMPGMEAFDGLTALHERAPSTPIVVISMIESRKDVLHAIELGAHGFIPKSAQPAEVLEALRIVLSGQVYLPPSLLLKSSADKVRPAVRAVRMSAQKRLSVLTGRQREVADLLGQGMTNAQIAVALGLSESTVRLHVSTILDKLDLTNRTQVALLAAQTGETVSDEDFDTVSVPQTD